MNTKTCPSVQALYYDRAIIEYPSDLALPLSEEGTFTAEVYPASHRASFPHDISLAGHWSVYYMEASCHD